MPKLPLALGGRLSLAVFFAVVAILAWCAPTCLAASPTVELSEGEEKNFEEATEHSPSQSNTASASISLPDADVEQMSGAATPARRAPALFLCHGGGPLPILGDPSHAELVKVWKKHREELFPGNALPKAIAVVSAHYEQKTMKVTSSPKPEMFYDYGGFPPESYKLQYPAPGNPELAEKAVQLLKNAGIEASTDPKRGFDHGMFVPLMIMFPEANIPVIGVSVLRSQNVNEHIAAGAALSALRDEGVFVLGSGSSSHNFAMFDLHARKGGQIGKTFHDQLISIITDPKQDPKEKIQALTQWPSWKGAEECQVPGAAEHFMPLFTCLGTSKHFTHRPDGVEPPAGTTELPRLLWKGDMFGCVMAHFLFTD